jgi:hypothetical protein
VVLVNRLGVLWELDWDAVPEHLTENRPLTRLDIVIGRVDARAARAVIYGCATRSSSVGVLARHREQCRRRHCVLGEPLNYENPPAGNRLRAVEDLYPEVVNPELEEETLPSCIGPLRERLGAGGNGLRQN